MKNVLFITCCLFVISCQEKTNQQESYSITGNLNGAYSDYVYLTYSTLGKNSVQVKDSSKVVNGKFSFTGSVDSPIQGWINAKPSSNIAWLYLENSDIQLETSFTSQEQNGEVYRQITIDTVIGSKSYLLQKDFQQFYQSNKEKNDFQDLLKSKVSEVITKNPNHYFSGQILAENVMFSDTFSYEEAQNLFKIIDTTAQADFELTLIKTGLSRLDRFKVGNQILDLELPDTSDSLISSTSLRGKIVLVDFWASWCAPCRDKHPDYVNLYKEYKDDNFEILSVSIDEEKEPWLKAIEDDQMTWKQMIDLGGFEGKTAKDYFILAIPINYLIDERGIIVGMNMEPEDISEFIEDKTNASESL